MDRRITVPCGKCNLCLKKRANQWFLRLFYELKTSTSAHFVTLTYETAPRSYNALKTCKKEDLQNYFKRLRQREKGNKYIKYYACSEYGSHTHRPHYHAIVFNVREEKNLYRSWSVRGHYIGGVVVAPVNDQRMRYVTGYIEKKVGIGAVDYDDRLPEFSRMSKNLGLYYTKIATLHHSHTLNGFTQIGKRKFSLPRYYKQKMFPDKKTNFITYAIDHNGFVIDASFTITEKNSIANKISKNNYERFLITLDQRKKDFSSELAWLHNSSCLAERDNPTLTKILNQKKLDYANQKSILQQAHRIQGPVYDRQIGYYSRSGLYTAGNPA